ncbi:MAG: autotransporter-associated beta strand repeat-containing protein [Verrucomicrobiales bacterium]
MAILLFAPTRETGAVVFEFEYADASGQGFFDPVLGSARRSALEHAGNIWGSLIPSAYVGEVITVNVSYADLGAGTPRASTKIGYLYPAPTKASTHFPKALANHLSGMDVDPAKDEITIQFNSNLPTNYWYYGLDAQPSPTEADFVTTALHEIGHGLGFGSSFRANGGYGVFGDGTFDADEARSGWATIYDWFVTLGPNGNLVFNGTQSQIAAAVVSDNIYWNGAQATSANGGNPVPLFAPTMYTGLSSISHVDDALSDALMQPTRPGGKAIHLPMAIERAMLRDMGWNIAVAPATVAWSGLGGDNSWTTAANWVGMAVPRGGDSLAFGPSPQTDVAVLYDSGSFAQHYLFLNTLNFAADAPAYTLRFKPRTSTRFLGSNPGTGIINFSGQTHQIILESSFRDGLWIPPLAAKVTFDGGAIAGNTDYLLRGGGTTIAGGPLPHVPLFLQRHPGASIVFQNNSSAGTASFVIEGGAGDGGPNAQVTFQQNASAGAAKFRAKGGLLGLSLPQGNVATGFGGQVLFQDKATAGGATIDTEGQAETMNGPGGFAVFTGSSTAADSQIHNHGSTYVNGIGGGTYFSGNSTAGAAEITNDADGANSVTPSVGARTVFQDSATAGDSTIENVGAPGQSARHGHTEFRHNSTAANATINNRGHITVGGVAGRTIFYDSATAATATINMHGGYSDDGRLEFRQTSSAATAQINLINVPSVVGRPNNGGIIVFYDNSTAAQSRITLQQNGQHSHLRFYNNATAGDAQITAQDFGGLINFFDKSTAANADMTLGRSSTTIFGAGTTAAQAKITMGYGAALQLSESSAGEAEIVAAGSSLYPWGGGAITFNSFSTAADATITLTGAMVPLAAGASVSFINSSHAGNSTITAHGGTNGGAGATVSFYQSHGDTARLIAHAGATVTFINHPTFTAFSIGSIEGAGTFILQGNELTVGTRNIDSATSGPIIDSPTGFNAGGRLIKVGTGRLTLAGTNTYSGLTTAAGGELRVDGSIAGDAVVQSGATLSGTGSIGGVVTVNPGGVFAPGTSAGTIAVGGLTLTSGGALHFELGDAARDHIRLTDNGNIALAGTLNLSLVDGFTPTLGQSFPLFEGSIGTITGSFDSIDAPTFDGLTFDLVRNAGSVMLQVVAQTPGPRLAILNVAYTEGNLTITWESEAGATYTVERSVDLGNWNPIATVPGGVNSTSWTDDAPPLPSAKTQYFYRVSAQ